MRPMQIAVKNKLFLFTFLTVLLCLNNPSSAIVSEDIKDETYKASSPNKLMAEHPQGYQKAEKPQYAPGEVIIKLKEKKTPQLTYSQSYSERAVSQEGTLSGIKTKYKLKDEKPVFKGLHNRLKTKNLSQMKLDVMEVQKQNKARATILKQKETVDLLPIYILKTDEDVLSLCEKLKKDPDIEYAEPNYIMKIQMVPNDPYYSSQGSWGQAYDDLWGLKKIQCEEAWDISQGEGVVVAVIDTGVDYNHEDLAGNIWTNDDEIPKNGIDDDGNGYVDDVRGWDFANNDNDPMDDHGHGTHVSGTIAAIGNNNIGVIGVAPKAKIMAVKGISDSSMGSGSNLADCIYYAANNGAKVLSNSWGAKGTSQLLTDAFHYAHDLGCVSIASAGNDNMDVANFTPANIDTVIAVAASNQNDEKCSFSNWGSKIDVAAPGGDSPSGDGTNVLGRNILSLRSDNNGNPTDMYGDAKGIVGDRYYRSRGTSMACPYVAGLAALVLSSTPIDNDLLRTLLRNSADDLGEPGFDEYYGWGRINANRCLELYHSPNGTIWLDSDLYRPSDLADIRVVDTDLNIDPHNLDTVIIYATSDTEITPEPIILTETGPKTGIFSGQLSFDFNPTPIKGDGKLQVQHKDIIVVTYYEASPLGVKEDSATIDAISVSLDFIYPTANSFIRGNVDIMGDIHITTGFERYELYYAPLNDPANPILINSSTIIPLNGSTLGTWATINNPDGEYLIILKVISTDNREWSITVNVIVDNINESPSFNPLSNKGIVIGRLLEFKVEANDADDPSSPEGQLEYLAYNLPPGSQFVPETQIFSWKPTEAEKGAYEVTFIVKDSENSVSKIISISTVYMREIRITTDPHYQGKPSIYEDKIVWSDLRNGDWDIYMYDLSTGMESRIAAQVHLYPGYGIGDIPTPHIYQNKIIWDDTRNGWFDIYIYDLSTGKESRITSNTTAHAWPFIHEDKIVWTDKRNIPDGTFWWDSNADIYMYDLATGRETQITTNLCRQDIPAIYGDKIVWADWRNPIYKGSSDIYMYDLSTGKETRIPVTTYPKKAPYIYKDKIAWTGLQTPWSHIFTYDLSTGEERQITTNLYHNEAKPSIYGDKIVWEATRVEDDNPFNFISDMYMYSFSTNQEIQITFSGSVRLGKSTIYQDKIVWSENYGYAYGNGDIYLAELFFVPQITAISPTTASPDSLITISGRDFGYTQEESIVSFENGTICPVEEWSNSQIICRIPQNAKSGLLKVVTLGGKSNYFLIAVNHPPVLRLIGDKEVQIGHYLLFPVSATDPDGDKIRYGADNLPNGAVFIHVTEPLYKLLKKQYPNLTYPCNLFYWQPKGNQVGQYKVTFWAEDLDESGHPKSRSQEEITITVKRPPNKPPWIQFVQNYRNTLLRWRGFDTEDKFNLEYSYRVDNGTWSKWAKTDSIAIRLLSKGLKKGNHIFYVKARDSQGCESQPKSTSFYIR